MPSVCFYFQVHQPYRIKKFRIFDIGQNLDYFNTDDDTNLNNKKILQKVASKSYLPTNAILLELIKKYPQFKVSFSLSGVLIEQLEKYSPQTLTSFQKLVKTGRVEILSETYFHSLSFLYSRKEFESQINQHKQKIKEIFNYKPQVFRNTELIYNNDLALAAEKMGFKAVLAEGIDHVLKWRSPNFVYKPKGTKKIKLLLKNYKLSDDIAFRFSSKWWQEYPLTAPKFASWVNTHNGSGELINLFMDYETFGEHQWEDTGIFEFLKALPKEILAHPDNDFVTPSEAASRYIARDEIDIPHLISWADVERDLSAWLSNPMQNDAISKLYLLEKEISSLGDKDLLESWRRMQTSDHFYYMCTKWFADGDVHKYFNPYNSPYEAFISFMNVLSDVKLRIKKISNGKSQMANLHLKN